MWLAALSRAFGRNLLRDPLPPINVVADRWYDKFLCHVGGMPSKSHLIVRGTARAPLGLRIRLRLGRGRRGRSWPWLWPWLRRHFVLGAHVQAIHLPAPPSPTHPEPWATLFAPHVFVPRSCILAAASMAPGLRDKRDWARARAGQNTDKACRWLRTDLPFPGCPLTLLSGPDPATGGLRIIGLGIFQPPFLVSCRTGCS